jgi:predicted acyltransferase
LATSVERQEVEAAARQPARLASVDALRGFDMFWIIGGDALFQSVAVLASLAPLTWAADQMTHAEWDGFTFYDLIFPLFVFVSGVTLPYSLGRRLEAGTPRRQLVWPIVRRGLILVLLGVVYNNGLFRMWLSDMRYPSVLGRIGLAGMGAGLIVLFTGLRGRVLWLVGLLVGYWLALAVIPVPGVGAGQLSAEGSLVGWVDRALVPGQLFGGVHDPEGLLSTVPAVGSALAGALAGDFLRRAGRSGSGSGAADCLALAGAGAAAVAAGATWGVWFPVNKNLWTSSFVLVTAGLSLALLALFHYLIDVRGWQRWSKFFAVIGVNSILIYFAGRVIDFGYATNFFLAGPLSHVGEDLAAVLWWTGFVAIEWLFLWFLDRRHLYLKV